MEPLETKAQDPADTGQHLAGLSIPGFLGLYLALAQEDPTRTHQQNPRFGETLVPTWSGCAGWPNSGEKVLQVVSWGFGTTVQPAWAIEV